MAYSSRRGAWGAAPPQAVSHKDRGGGIAAPRRPRCQRRGDRRQKPEGRGGLDPRHDTVQYCSAGKRNRAPIDQPAGVFALGCGRPVTQTKQPPRRTWKVIHARRQPSTRWRASRKAWCQGGLHRAGTRRWWVAPRLYSQYSVTVYPSPIVYSCWQYLGSSGSTCDRLPWG